ncbi:MAG: hypothetical protein DRI98_06660 [Bacteroidetes bacterium]|nr:MAG: hypothetical protein DRI98_06660 [Bacteroidota bacterium]
MIVRGESETVSPIIVGDHDLIIHHGLTKLELFSMEFMKVYIDASMTNEGAAKRSVEAARDLIKVLDSASRDTLPTSVRMSRSPRPTGEGECSI